MIYYSQKNISDRISESQKTILIARNDPGLSTVLSKYGYVEASFDEGLRLQDEVRLAEENRLEQLGLQVAASTTLKALYRTMRLTFDADRKIVRLAVLNDPVLSDTFRLHIRTTKRQSAFILQAAHLYEQMRDHVDLLSERFNFTQPVIDERLAALNRLNAAFQEQQQAIGQSRVATEARREAMQALDRWMKEFIAVARIAFRDETAKLSKLGIRVQSSSRNGQPVNAADVVNTTNAVNA